MEPRLSRFLATLTGLGSFNALEVSEILLFAGFRVEGLGFRVQALGFRGLMV